MVGSLLGDGYLNRSQQYFPAFQERHCEAQLEYLKFKKKVLDPFGRREIRGPFGNSGFGKGKLTYEWGTMSHPWMTELHDEFYNSRKKRITQKVISWLDPIVLAIWYCDDGSCLRRRKSNNSFTLRLHTLGYSDEDRVLLIQGLKSKFGLEFSSLANGDLVIYGQAKEFQEIVAPYVPECMSYKLPYIKDHSVIGSFWGNEHSVPLSGTSPVPVLSVHYHKPTHNDGKFLYNIEVEGQHRYFVSGILVANSGANDEFWRALQMGHPLPAPRIPFAVEKLEAMIKGSGVDIYKDGSKLQLTPMTDQQIKAMSNGEIKDALAIRGKDLKPEKGGIFDPVVTGGVGGQHWNHVKLSEPTPNPAFEIPVRELLGITEVEYRDYVNGNRWVDKTGKIVDRKTRGAKTGGAALRILLSQIDIDKDIQTLRARASGLKGSELNKAHRKLRYLKALKEKNQDPTVYILDNFPVIPAAFRPIYSMPDGSLGVSQVNELYKDMILVNNQLRNKDLPDDLKGNLRRDLYDGLKGVAGLGSSLSGRQRKGLIEQITGDQPKTGFFQSKIMGRRQDFTGRSTIIPEPTLGLDETMIPEAMAWKLYEPFVIRELVMLGKTPLQAKEHLDNRDDTAKKALELAMQGRPVLLNRAPTLHKFSIMAFIPKLTSGKAIKTNPLINEGFNLDHDGDTMGVHVPITEEARKEAFKLLPSANLYSVKDGSLMNLPRHEQLLGLYLMTKDGKITRKTYGTLPAAKLAYDKREISITDVIKIGGKRSSLGRALVNSVFPIGYQDIKTTVSKKSLESKLEKLSKESPQKFAQVVSKLKDLGNQYSYEAGFTVSLSDLDVDYKYRDKIFAEAERKSKNIGTIKAYTEATKKLDTWLSKELGEIGRAHV